MTLTIDLQPEEASRLSELADGQGIDVQECARRIIGERLAAPTGRATSRLLTRDEIDARLIEAGVRPGNREGALALLEAWSKEDADPEGTVEEWEEIQRNIERGGIDLRRVHE